MYLADCEATTTHFVLLALCCTGYHSSRPSLLQPSQFSPHHSEPNLPRNTITDDQASFLPFQSSIPFSEVPSPSPFQPAETALKSLLRFEKAKTRSPVARQAARTPTLGHRPAASNRIFALCVLLRRIGNYCCQRIACRHVHLRLATLIHAVGGIWIARYRLFTKTPFHTHPPSFSAAETSLSPVDRYSVIPTPPNTPPWSHHLGRDHSRRTLCRHNSRDPATRPTRHTQLS